MTQVTTLPRPLTRERAADGVRHGLRDVLGTTAWSCLLEAVRERFADSTAVRSTRGVRGGTGEPPGRVFAWVGTLFGTPVAPRVESHVAARVLVRPDARGVAWDREYLWADGTRSLVCSTKVVTEDGLLIEMLPAHLCMPLDTYVEGGVLHFVSRGYYFHLGAGFRLWLPALLSPGVTHVEHIDLGHGWFRFTMTVTHPLGGEVYFQTGRFCAAEELP
jgi:hypothetical protein